MSKCVVRLCTFSSTFAMLLTSLVAANQTTNRKQYRAIESYTDLSADPCIDFYQYACGNWEIVHKTSDYADTLEYLDHEINHEYGHMLKTRKKTFHRQNQFVRQVLAYLKSCMDVEEFQPSLYMDWLSENENVSWPSVLQHSNNTRSKNNSFDWLFMLATLRKYGLNGVLLSGSVLQNRDDSRHFLIDIDRPVMDDEFERLSHAQFELVVAYMNVTRKRSRQLWNAFERFEAKLIELYDIEDDLGYDEVKVSDIEVPQIKRYMKIVFGMKHFDRNMLVAVTNLPYIRALLELLHGYDDEFVCRYLMIRFLWHINYNGPTAFTKIACISNLREQMPLAMTWLYEAHYPALVQESEHIGEMFENLRSQFSRTLNGNPNSFDAQILEFLNQKLQRMQLKVGNMPRNATAASIDEFYRDLMLSETDFYGNHLKLLRFYTHKQQEHLHVVVPLDAQHFYYLEDNGPGATSTPYFLQRSNLVIVPITLLHLPMYHPQLHDVFKYSLMGFLLAHEITHGFDDSGLDYDQYGNMFVASEAIKENSIFDGNLKCLRAKNPRVIDEKIADVSGLRWAFEAYLANVARIRAASSWLKMPQAQLFFRNFALFFCGSRANDQKLVNSTHGTWRSRLHDTISQFPKFGEVYGCPAGSPMNPLRKCQLWR